MKRTATLLLAMTALTMGRGKPTPLERPGAFRTEARLVMVPVTVLTKRGEPVTGLARDVFRVSEDGVERHICSFHEDDGAISVGIVFDVSGSMRPLLGLAKESLKAVVAGLNASDNAFLAFVSDGNGRGVMEFGSEFDAIPGRVSLARASGSTALIDAIYGSYEAQRHRKDARKALVVISDGMDNHSRHSLSDLLKDSAEWDEAIYSVTLATPTGHKAVEVAEESRGPLLLNELASQTGAISFRVYDHADLSRATSVLSHALHNRYNIGYVPDESPLTLSKWRKIRVTVSRPGLKVHARAGYRSE